MPITKHTMDPTRRPSQDELMRIDAIRDEDIDYSDSPELADAFFRHAKVLEPPRSYT